MNFDGPVQDLATDAERILRSLPRWFGIESSLLAYAQDTKRFPTFTASEHGEVIAFLTLRQHAPSAWELHCVAVLSSFRSRGAGRRLHRHAEDWLVAQQARFLQVKTLAPAHPSPEYADTRAFYRAMGYCELEVFDQLWGPGLPVLQWVKGLKKVG